MENYLVLAAVFVGLSVVLALRLQNKALQGQLRAIPAGSEATNHIDLSGLMAMRLQNNSVQRKLREATAELDATKRSHTTLIAENFNQAQSIERLVAIEHDFYQLRREHGRANATIAQLCRVQAGITAECEKLERRVAALTLGSAPSAELQKEIEPMRRRVGALLDWSRQPQRRETAAA